MRATVEWQPDGSAQITLPHIPASSPEEADRIARRLILKACQRAHIDPLSIDVTDIELEKP